MLCVPGSRLGVGNGQSAETRTTFIVKLIYNV